MKPKENKGFEHCREDRKGAVSGPETVRLFISIPDSELDHFWIPFFGFCGFTDSWDVWILRVSLFQDNYLFQFNSGRSRGLEKVRAGSNRISLFALFQDITFPSQQFPTPPGGLEKKLD